MTTTRPGRLRSALLAIPLVTAGLLGATTAPAQAATTPDGPLTCRGAGIDPAAKLHHRTETLVKAPLSTLWKLHTDVAGWPPGRRPSRAPRSWTPGRCGRARGSAGPPRHPPRRRPPRPPW
jgi:hypothetical protein